MKTRLLINKIKSTTNTLLKTKNINQDKLQFLVQKVEQNVGLQKLNNITLNKLIFKKGNPFFFIRKNYKLLFENFLKRSFITPNLLKFLHMAYWPKNDYKPWRMFYNYHSLELKQRKIIKKPIISNFVYFFSQIFKKPNIHYFFNLISTNKYKIKFFKRLAYLYNLNVKNYPKIESKLQLVKKKNLLKLRQKLHQKLRKKLIKKNLSTIIDKFKYFKIPHFIMKDRKKKEFKNFFLLTFRQRSFLRNLITFYFPVISLVIKEMTIHSLPMKTKKPRRV